MPRIRVQLQNNRTLETTIEIYDSRVLADEISKSTSSLVPIGDIIVNKLHIEYISEIQEVITESQV